jgi:hypothetical protein
MIVCMGHFIINNTCVMEYESGTICHRISRLAALWYGIPTNCADCFRIARSIAISP